MRTFDDEMQCAVQLRIWLYVTVIGALDTVESTKSTISIDLRSFTLRTTNNSFLYQDSTKNALISRCRKGSASSFFVQRFWRVPVLTLQWQPLSWLAKLRIRAARPWHTSPTSEMWCQNFSLRQIKKLASDLPLAIVLGMAAWPREAIGMYPKDAEVNCVCMCIFLAFWFGDHEIEKSWEECLVCQEMYLHHRWIMKHAFVKSHLSTLQWVPCGFWVLVSGPPPRLLHLSNLLLLLPRLPQTWWMVSLYIGPIHLEAQDPLGEYWWMAWTLWRLRLVVLSHIRLMSSVKPSWDWSYLHGMSVLIVLILDIMIGQCMCLKFVPLPTLSQPPASNWPLHMVSSWFTRSHRNHPTQPSHNKGFLVSGQ